jgi:hypothetical protein
MPPLERLFALELEYQRLLRCDAPGTPESVAPHTSYALQSGYEPLLRSVGRVTAQDLEKLSRRFSASGDARDVLAARDSLMTLLGLWREPG